MIYLLAVISIIIAIEVPRLVKNKMWRELTAFFVLLTIGFIYSAGQIYDWPLPNPTAKMEYMFEPVWENIKKMLP